MTTLCITPQGLLDSSSLPSPTGVALLASASFEDRSTTVATHLPDAARFEVGLLYANEEFLQGDPADRTSRNMDLLTGTLRKHCDKVEIAVGSWLDPAKQLAALRQLARALPHSRVTHPASIHIDATTFTRESLLVACALFRQSVSPAPLRLLYTAPESHGSWLSRGYRGVRNVMGFPGIQSPGAPTTLVVLSGFEPDRILRVIEAYEPSTVLLGIGNPPTTPDFLSRNVADQRLILSRQDVFKFDFPAVGIVPCVTAIEAAICPYAKTTNLVLAPMCTKMSTVASLLVAEGNPAMQLAYCLPGEYNTAEYSDGARFIYIEDIQAP